MVEKVGLAMLQGEEVRVGDGRGEVETDQVRGFYWSRRCVDEEEEEEGGGGDKAEQKGVLQDMDIRKDRGNLR